MQIVLASGSIYRQNQLRQIGLPFAIEVPNVDEGRIKEALKEPLLVATELAKLKGQEIVRLHPDAVVIAADQVAQIDGEILSKPRSRERALAQLERLQGRTHELLTALWMHHPTLGPKAKVITATMTLRKLPGSSLEHYVDREQPYDCAGSYKIEQAGISLIERMECEDPTSIVGLPLISVVSFLREWGMPLPFEIRQP